MKALTAFFAAALGAGALLAQTVDQNKFKPLHDAGKAFEKGLDDPSASVEEVRDLRQKLDREAAVSAGAAATAEEKRVVEIYSASARGYQDARDRFDRDKSRAKYFADLHRIQSELKEADELYNGTAKLAPPPPPKAAPPAVVSEPSVAPAPPAPARVPPAPPVQAPPPPAPVIPPAPPVKTPPPPASVVPPTPPVVVPPPPAPVAPPAPPVVVPPPPAPVAPPAPPIVVPPPPAPVTPPSAAESMPAAVAAPPPVAEKTAPPTPEPPATPPPAPATPPVAPPPAPPPAALPREAPPAPSAEPAPPRADVALNSFRKAANRVKIDKDSSAVSGCSRVAEFTVADSGSGVYEIAGHNFYYGNTQELIRLKTAEAGGDRFVMKAKSKTEISGEAYRCGK